METRSGPHTQGERYDLIDALHGFALVESLVATAISLWACRMGLALGNLWDATADASPDLAMTERYGKGT